MLRALRPFLSFGWLLIAGLAAGAVAMGAGDVLRTVANERHASVLSCAEWSRRTPRPAWVHLSGCRLLADQRIALDRSGSGFMPAPVLVPLARNDGIGPPLAYVLLPRDFDRDPSQSALDGFAGLVRPLTGYRASTAYDERLPILHPDEPGALPLALVLATVWLLVAFWRRLRRNLRDVDATDRIAERVRASSAPSANAIDISPLLELRRAILVSAPCWGLAVFWLVASTPFGDDPFAWGPPLGAALTIVGGSLFLWERGRPSRLALVASIAPLGGVALGVGGLFITSDPVGRWVYGLLATYGVLAAGRLVRALRLLRNNPARATLLEIEREWLWTRRQTHIRLMVGKALWRYLFLHAAGLVLAAIVAPILVVAGLGGFGAGLGLAIFVVFRRWAQRHAMPNAAEVLATDARTPVLFLRSFGDEDLVVRSRSHRADRSISEWVAAQFSLIGPVVAIAKPGQHLPQVGPYRIELPSHGDWQAEVCERVERSAAIVLVLGATRGLLWELGQIAQRGALPRTFFVFPPVEAMGLEWRWQQIVEHVAVVPQLQTLFTVDPRHLLMARTRGDDELMVVCSRIRVAASYEMAFAAMRIRSALAASERPRGFAFEGRKSAIE